MFILKWLQQYRQLVEMGCECNWCNVGNLPIQENLNCVVKLWEKMKEYWKNREEVPWWISGHPWWIDDNHYLKRIERWTTRSWICSQKQAQCHRAYCGNVRSDVDKWIKCSSCLVSVYCSHGDHKRNCKVFTHLIHETQDIDPFLPAFRRNYGSQHL